MFAATAMTPQERRKIALEMTRLRIARYSSRGHRARRPPPALPCNVTAKAFADVTVPMGVVAVTEAEDFARWLLVARPVSQKEAETKGGCIMYVPPAGTSQNSSSSSSAKPRYFCIMDTDDEVYGRAVYLPRPCGTHEEKP
ncbi:hypothetical protein ABB37_09106 [Leptomonas pyrrhocoris]|uniref:Uncharacterized protein n=1 Tax=Leptomonas pyrrhocoris TaxID=157538 RepID=A0A0N0VD16_LEPPY|nr:hypothetical protein ABB37_09106 [Leptomonas pyrrhocoris]XP_015652842.1 hypothetical protein ABB37_09106 [Leptomonas pyrrhocoris]KPA74402.1 hypothetical protein ABB37_09106 [Leptomonas pyrrhocoris]KPA74403.1 hypothetical protein ABB37_09106 [Leptomonas pyrrhocoris]|eukprot:XP_015652841.1 hypothetical protein ABB37_09106 [Leptomonas pyrrhocoris]